MQALWTFLESVLPDGGLGLLLTGTILAGLVRGFTGFGTGMVYLPFAAQVLPPVWVLVTMIVIDLVGPLPAVPRALRDSTPRDLIRLGIGTLIGAPFGAAILTALPPEVFRYTLSVVALMLLALLAGGLRYTGPVRGPLIYGTGWISGVFAGSIGLGGPPVILLYMARPLPLAVIRANTLLFLLMTDALLFVVFGARGLLELAPVLLGLCLIPPYIAALTVGAALFDPVRERAYRSVAYFVIAGAAISGLPFWDG